MGYVAMSANIFLLKKEIKMKKAVIRNVINDAD